MADSVTPPKSEFLKTLTSRGYMHQATNLDGLDRLAEQQPISAYIGLIAPLTATLSDRLSDYDAAPFATHRPQTNLLMGGGTTKVGDPSPKMKPPIIV